MAGPKAINGLLDGCRADAPRAKAYPTVLTAIPRRAGPCWDTWEVALRSRRSSPCSITSGIV